VIPQSHSSLSLSHLNTTVAAALTSILLASRASVCARADHQRQTEQTRQVVRNKTATVEIYPAIHLFALFHLQAL
jgi:ABC-type proline/glycine betaine transport system permease subunit